MDILGLGYTAVDDLLLVDAYPVADSKMPVRRRDRQCGGLAATALVAAARLGCRCAYAGTLGDDDYSRFVLDRFCEEGIDVSHVRRLPDARPVRSTIIVDGSRQTRTILYDLNGVAPVDATWPSEEVIRSVKVLLVDHCGIGGMARAARIARDAKIPVVADLEGGSDPAFPVLLELSDHLILSRDFAVQLTGRSDPAAAALALWTPRRRASVVTCGGDGCWFVSHREPTAPRHQPAMTLDAVDTTGCGDVFHGAYAAALVLGRDVAEALRFATVTAGIKATRPGGQAGIPDLATVEAQLASER